MVFFLFFQISKAINCIDIIIFFSQFGLVWFGNIQIAYNFLKQCALSIEFNQSQNGREATTKWFACCVIYFPFLRSQAHSFSSSYFSFFFRLLMSASQQKEIRLWSHYSLNLIEFIVHFTSFVISPFEIEQHRIRVGMKRMSVRVF